MAPNSEERRRIDAINWNEDALAKEKLRPPIYNPEDYALSLRKWGRRPPSNGPGLYMMPSHSDTDLSRSHTNTLKDYGNPLISAGSEMTLRQFGTVSELLNKLKADLRLAYPSFVQEFVGDPFDGITLLLDLLRAIQLSQANNSHYTPGSSATTGKIPPSVQRRALLDELTCLQCLLCSCSRYAESVRKLTSSSAGLFTLAVCIMSNVNKSRIIALQLLAKACESSANGHAAVSEALSTLRLRFGEPVRFRFLVGMISSASGQSELLATGLQFVNAFLESTGSAQKRLYIQAELEQAGFDLGVIKKNIPSSVSSSDAIFDEIRRLEKNHIDVESLILRAADAQKESDCLRDKLLLLERRVQILHEEKGILVSLEQCLKERCNELQDEVISLQSGKSLKMSNRSSQKRGASTPAEDEGISSSERSITPEDVQQEPSIYEIYNANSKTIKIQDKSERLKSSLLLDDEEETTIEEVMEELNNIINKAESEEYKKDTEWKKRVKMEEAQVKSKIQMRVSSNVSVNDSYYDECEIVPSNLHPQPPRKTRSLIHLFVPSEDYDYNNKEIFFENETMYTSEEGSDSLLSASKCIAKHDKSSSKNVKVVKETNKTNFTVPSGPLKLNGSLIQNCILTQSGAFTQNSAFKHNASFKQIGSFAETAALKPKTNYGDEKTSDCYLTMEKKQKMKSKSLDRIDDGLGTLVDIVVTNQKQTENSPFHLRPQSDSGNASNTLRKSSTKSSKLSQIFASQAVEEKHRIFLPINKYDEKEPYYFPRVQEKRNHSNSANNHSNNSLQIKRGQINAGLYSGHVQIDNTKKIDYFSTTCSKNSNSKISDLPSGLY